MPNRSALRTVSASADRPQCDHCFEVATYRVVVTQPHGESLAELHYCTARMVEKVAEEPHRIAGVLNLTVDAALPIVR